MPKKFAIAFEMPYSMTPELMILIDAKEEEVAKALKDDHTSGINGSAPKDDGEEGGNNDVGNGEVTNLLNGQVNQGIYGSIELQSRP